ncbi:WhiB family transcriptional regulator [Streptomyces sp. NPDC004237]|uniref:WhiB family transcriptional regulator n=1 Tax=Streptomyces sp. NPDC004237 TaxID=3154455 RepID=UPI0033BAD7D8
MSVTGSSCPPPAWQATAACAGLPPRVVFSKKVKEVAPALRACARCPVRRDCEEAVAPAANWFDGVCGGRLWRRGRPVEIPAHLLPVMRGPVVQGALRRGGSVA